MDKLTILLLLKLDYTTLWLKPEQRMRMEDIRNDEWFKKNYVPVSPLEAEEVDLDDIYAVFDESEVIIEAIFHYLSLLVIFFSLIVRKGLLFNISDV